jgi:eukaryotic-like serine/threonine-protein kinase
MELLQGETIAARLKSGPLPTELALHYASQIAAALADAHEHGIVHRDLKPGNIMLVKSGVKVLDFGLAIREGDATITDSRMVIGTPAYMAPEQREGKPADVRTDIYSFGCIFYEMLTGSRVTPDRKPLPSKTLEKAVNRCLEADPARRWQSVLDLMNAIRDSGARKNRNWMVVAAMLVAALLVAMGTGPPSSSAARRNSRTRMWWFSLISSTTRAIPFLTAHFARAWQSTSNSRRSLK